MHPHHPHVCWCFLFYNRNPKARLALVGTGPDSDALKEHFAGTKTVLTGVMSGEALSQAFASADVFVMPSDSETLGFVVLESMASGVPVVGANAGGIPDLIADGEVRFGCCIWACLWCSGCVCFCLFCFCYRGAWLWLSLGVFWVVALSCVFGCRWRGCGSLWECFRLDGCVWYYGGCGSNVCVLFAADGGVCVYLVVVETLLVVVLVFADDYRPGRRFVSLSLSPCLEPVRVSHSLSPPPDPPLSSSFVFVMLSLVVLLHTSPYTITQTLL